MADLDLRVRWALDRLHAAGRIVRQDLPGMRVVGPDTGPTILGGRRWWRRSAHRWVCEGGWHDGADPGPDAEPVLTDAATVGGLLALLREARSQPELCTQYLSSGWAVPRLCDTDPGWVSGHASEGEAIAGALIALAEAL